MAKVTRERLAEHLRVADTLGPAMVNRGVLQHFFVSPALPTKPLRLNEISDAWQRHVANVQARRAPELVHLYVHIPFCSHRCRYCVYYSIGRFESQQLEAYLARVHEELDYYASILGSLGVSTCYFGGGTPTVLSVQQLDDLLTHLDAVVTRKRGGEWAFECNPFTVTAAKARVFRDHGFNRVSFGVQTLNAEVLEGVNRGYQSYLRVAETFRVMQEMNFWINVDLIHGLPGESLASMLRSFEQILHFEPGQVTVYAISPYTPIAELDTARFGPIGESLQLFLPVAERYGYCGGAGTTCLYFMTKTARPNNLLTMEGRFRGRALAYDDTTIEPFSLLGIGPTARCYIYGQLRYMLDRYPVDTPFDPQASCATGRAVSMDEERRRFVVYQLEQARGLRASEFARLFGQPLGSAFGSELASLFDLGLLERRNGALMHTSEDARQRFATELCFVPSSMLSEVLRQQGATAGQVEVALAERPADELPDTAEPDEGPTLRIAASGIEARVILADYWPDRPCYHHSGDFAFFVPSDLPEGTCRLGRQREQLLLAFALLFDRVVGQDAPKDRAALLRALEAEVGRRAGITMSLADPAVV